MNCKFSLLLVVLALSACSSQPQTSNQGLGPSGSTKSLKDLDGSRIAMPVGLFLTSLDVDRDRRVSRSEVRDGVSESFNTSDKDRNGFLSPIEFEDWSKTYLGSEFAAPYRLHFDRDQDARVSLSEFTTTFSGIQERLDTDENGVLARAEMLVEINGLGIDPEAMRAQMEAEMRKNMQGKIREMCQRGARGR